MDRLSRRQVATTDGAALTAGRPIARPLAHSSSALAVPKTTPQLHRRDDRRPEDNADCLNEAVDAFDEAVGDLGVEPSENTVAVPFDGARDLF
jgi:hypothetical protein